MSFDTICSNCGAPSSPSVGVCPYCKGTMSSGSKGDKDTPTVTRITQFWKDGLIERALETARQAEQLKPQLIKKPNFVLVYVKILLEVDAPGSRIRSLLAKALVENPDHPELLEYAEIADAKSKLGEERNDAGELELANIIRRSPNNVHALFLLGSHLFWVEKEPTRAFKFLERCVRQRPNFLRALACLGALYKEVEMPGPAKKIFLQCVKLENDKTMKKYFKELAASC